ncbi:MAG TPA: hypothetical protein VMS99_00055 [Acidimicrobiia bacterium]|nr:hypothetical protein [Acidimicrobiia bacterium]
MTAVVMASAGLAVAGAPGAVLGLVAHAFLMLRRRLHRPDPPIRPVLLLLLVELKSGGQSALGALQAAARTFPGHRDLVLASRVATISGLTEAVDVVPGAMRGVVSQLARAQRSGAPLADTVRAMIESDIAADKARRVARARTMPVRLMVPITLLLLPGLVLLFYAPSMLRLFEELSRPLT